jgi:hypothetical protein
MRTRVVLASCLVVVGVALAAYAQMVNRPYHNGSVWNLTFARIKPGMDTAYLAYLTTNWKREQETAKQEGLILSYKVLGTESHGSNDWNLLLMVEYKDLATMEANQPKTDALDQRLFGSDQQQQQGYRERADIREIVGDRVAREIILSPRTQ